MEKERLILNTLVFEYPKEPVVFYFSMKDNDKRNSNLLKSTSLVPKEVRENRNLYNSLFSSGCLKLYTTFDTPCDEYIPIGIDFNEPENFNIVKRYYHIKLTRYFYGFDDVIVTQSGITKDLQLWMRNEIVQTVTYLKKTVKLCGMDKFTVKVKYDSFNNRPYILVSYDRPSLYLGISMKDLESLGSDNPFEEQAYITPSMINKVMMAEKRMNKDGNTYNVRKIEKLSYLHEKNIPYNPEKTYPIVSGEIIKFLGIDHDNNQRSFDSKYIKYLDKITDLKNRFLHGEALKRIFCHLAADFTKVNELQVGQTDGSKRMLVFGNGYKSVRPQQGVNYGPAINCPHKDVQLIAIYHQDDKDYASNLLGYFKNGNYQDDDLTKRKPLNLYIGSTVNYASPKTLHIAFQNRNNPIPEIRERLQCEDYQNLDPKVFYVGIYISPIHKYGSEKKVKECYYQVKELFLKQGIVTQCIEFDGMKKTLEADKGKQYKNFTYILQNMGVAICAKAGGSPWLLDATSKRELIIGIGAFNSDNNQYIGAAFSFDNTGIFNKYNYFPKNEIDELVGSIRKSIIVFSSVYERPNRIIIHYYKPISKNKEYRKIDKMLNDLSLDVPVYVVSINKTESEDIVVFDQLSNYNDKHGHVQNSLMPYSGKWINLGHSIHGYRYLLCNNTRYENSNFSKMDGFPFPVKLTITCPSRNDEIEQPVICQLIDQVYQFSRIYWKSVKQQGLPVTIKYPEMVAEIMPHFTNQAIYTDNNCLWFL